jgi:hypothetical protein
MANFIFLAQRSAMITQCHLDRFIDPAKTSIIAAPRSGATSLALAGATSRIEDYCVEGVSP